MARRGAEEIRLARRALEEGVEVAREAGRELWPILGLSTLAGAVVFFADHAAIDRDLAHYLRVGGWAALGLLFAPKLGALYRFALGGAAMDELGLGGLQWRRREWRLLATAVALIAFAAIAFAPLFAAAFATWALLRPLGVIELGPLGPLGAGFLLTAPVFALAFAALALALARLALVFPSEVAEREPRFARGWLLSRGHGRAVALTALLTVGATVAARLGLETVLDRLEAGAALEAGARSGWPLPDATGVGLLSAAAATFLVAPLTAGAFANLDAQFAAAEPAPVVVRSLTPLRPSTKTKADEAELYGPHRPSEPEPDIEPEPELAGPPPRLRLVHSVEPLDAPLAPAAAPPPPPPAPPPEAVVAASPPEPPLAPAAPAGEAEGGATGADSQERTGA